MEEKTPVYKLNVTVWDALKRFLSSDNPLSYLVNVFLNALWLIGKLIKKLLKLIKGVKPEENKAGKQVNDYGYEVHFNDLLKYARKEKTREYHKDLSVTVIVPIYNGSDHLRELFPSLEKNTSKRVKILLIDDCSSEKKTKDLIREYSERNRNWEASRNNTNLGFVGSINRGMSLVKTDLAVWLNSDTIVPSKWLERLTEPFCQDPYLATATPFTNSGVTFSYPVFAKDNELKFSLEEIDKAFGRIQSLNDGLDDTYSGTGFCMAVNMKAWNEVGELDEVSFGKGYGEENDWCFRALQNGYRHKIVPDLFVEHRHGGTFESEEKQKLQEEHAKVLLQRYPKLMNETIPTFLKEDPWKKYRALADLFLSDHKTVLFIDIRKESNDKSGAIDYAYDKIAEFERKDCRVILLNYEKNSEKWFVSPISIDSGCSISLDSFSDLNELFKLIFVKTVFINNLAFYLNPEAIIDQLCLLKDEHAFKLEYAFNDHLPACPSYFLINDKCLPCPVSKGQTCVNCLKENPYKVIERYDVNKWREHYRKLFIRVDSFLFFSDYTRKIITNVYPEIQARSHVVPHKPLMDQNASKYVPNEEKDGILRIAFVGHFTRTKGADLFIETAKKLKENIKSKFYIIGYADDEYKVDYEITGKYERNDLGKILSDKKIDLVIMPSFSNETYSYTVQELMLLKVPFVVFACGAPADRIRKENYRLAEIAEEVNADSLFKATVTLKDRLGL